MEKKYETFPTDNPETAQQAVAQLIQEDFMGHVEGNTIKVLVNHLEDDERAKIWQTVSKFVQADASVS